MTVVADTGAIFALMDRDDAWHERVRSWWETNREPIRLPVTVLPEIAYFAASRLGPRAELAFVRALADDEFDVEPLDEKHDLPRSRDLMLTYRDTPLGFVDASIIALTERLGAIEVLTTDRRHFSVVRPRHTPSLRLVP